MTLYVLKRDDGKYVARVGMASSYTTKLQHARVFRSREDADRDRCKVPPSFSGRAPCDHLPGGLSNLPERVSGEECGHQGKGQNMTNTELIATRVDEGRAVDWGEAGREVDGWMDRVTIPEAEQVFEGIRQWAQRKGWTVSVVERLPVSPGGKASDIPEAAMASTQSWEKAIFVRAKATPSQRVYLVAHELGHALGVRSDGLLEAGYVSLIRLGIMERQDVPKLRMGEAEAELTASLVLMGLKVVPNFSYFWNWGLSGAEVRAVRKGAERVAGGILEAIEGAEERTAA